MEDVKKIYDWLLTTYSSQGWWPILSHKGSNPTKTGSVNGYHPGDYSFPKNQDQVFEICLGAILTQNTGWPNVEKALLNLRRANALNLKGIKRISDAKLKELIKPAGYYNQKSRYIREFIRFFENKTTSTTAPSRVQLLSIKGIGPETADSMLLYAFKEPVFVVDAYTRRIFSNLNIIQEHASYDEIKSLVESSITPELTTYQEYHALLVEHAKRFYKKKEEFHKCPLLKLLNKS